MSKLGIITNPDNGFPVLVIQKTKDNDFIRIDRKQLITKSKKDNEKLGLQRFILRGNIGDTFNYVTLKNYGKQNVELLH